MMMRLGSLALLLCLALSACGDLPEPFLGNPGATGRRLAQPATPLLAVPPGSDTLLPDAANAELANQLATALQATEIPAMVHTPDKHVWRVITRAERDGDFVRPLFSIRDPQGKEQGSAEGEKVPLQTWAAATPGMLHQVAAEAAPRIGAVLSGIRLAQDKANPNSLYNRPAKVDVAEVTGAPGDGDQSLTQQMRSRLAVLGPIVLTTPTDADFVVQGVVRVVPIQKRQERVEIQWILKTPTGDERGRVIQLNEIPAGTLDHYWGDVAVVVAAEASRGINNLLRRQSGHDQDAAQQPAAAGAQQPGAGGSAAPQAGVNGSRPQPSTPAAATGQVTDHHQPAQAALR
ncbi:MAG TPA: hypothetical protein VHO91_09125 [Rhodopila sp.]|nr:hypothetical protein [Rhodopila sp.]